MPTNFPQVQKKAEEVLKKYNITEPIVNVFEIAENENLKIKFVDMPDGFNEVAGFMGKDGRTIYVNDADPVNRQTFTIAHELGHYFLQHQPDERGVLYRWSKFNGKTPVEQEANCFAGNLLVPKKMLKEQMKRYGLDENSLTILADLFGVSKEVIKYRLLKI